MREIPRWIVTRTSQRLGSPVECSLPYIACWSRWVNRLYGGGHTIPLVGDLGCGNLLNEDLAEVSQITEENLVLDRWKVVENFPY